MKLVHQGNLSQLLNCLRASETLNGCSGVARDAGFRAALARALDCAAMAGGDDTASGATVRDRPSKRLLLDGVRDPVEPSSTLDTIVDDRPPPSPPPAPEPPTSPGSLTTAADAMRNEEIERTRLFIRMGWAISVAAIATVPLLHAPRAMSVAFIAALAIGIVVSAF